MLHHPFLDKFAQEWKRCLYGVSEGSLSCWMLQRPISNTISCRTPLTTGQILQGGPFTYSGFHFGYSFVIFQRIGLKFLLNLPTYKEFCQWKILKIWRGNHQLCPIARRQQFWIFAVGKRPKFQNCSNSSGNKPNDTKSTILNNFCSSTAEFRGFSCEFA